MVEPGRKLRYSLKRASIPVIGFLLVFVLDSTASHAQRQTIVFGFKGTEAELALAEALVEKFNETQEAIEVQLHNMTARGANWPEHLSVLIAAGEAPDVIRMEYQRGLEYAYNGVLRPLDDLIAVDPTFDLDGFFPISLEAHRLNGELYGIPREAQPFTFFVNRTALDEAGISLPDPDWDITDFENIVLRTTRVDDFGNTVHYGWKIWYSETRIPPILYAFGGRLLNEERTRFLLDSPEVAEALRFMRNLGDRGALGGSFERGTATFDLSGPWSVPGFRDMIKDSFEWDVVPVPGGPGGRGTTLGSDAYYISKQSQHPDLALEFIKFMTSEESQAFLSSTGALVPSRRDVAVEVLLGAPSDAPPRNVEAYLLGLTFARPSPVFPKWFEFSRLIRAAWQDAIEGNANPNTIMQEIMPQLNALLQ